MNKLAEMIKKYREDNNLTQQDFAEQLNVSRQAVSKWETGSSYPNYEILKDIAKLLNTTVDNLLSKEEIVKETITVKSKNKRNMIIILLSSIIAIFAIITGVTAIVVSTNNIEKETIQEDINAKYLGFFMRVEDFNEEKPTKEEYDKEMYPGIYLVKVGGNYDAWANVRSSTNSKISSGTTKTSYQAEFTVNVNGKLLCGYYAFLNLDNNELYFEETGFRRMLDKNIKQINFSDTKIFNGKEYEYNITIKNRNDAIETKIIEYNNEFKKISEKIIDYEGYNYKDNYYYSQDYKVSDECLYVVVEDTFEDRIEKRLICREEMNNIVLLYHSEAGVFSSYIRFKY